MAHSKLTQRYLRGLKPPAWRHYRGHYRAVLQGDHLVRRAGGEGLVEIGEAADGGAVHQLLIDLPLPAALVAPHEEHALFGRHFGETLADGVALHQHVGVVLEEEHPDHVDAVGAVFELGQDHLAELVGDGVALGGEDIRDFHWQAP